MKQVKSFTGHHDDYVHDVAYDHYGKRLATCSSDHKIKIWGENTGSTWKCECEAELEGHRGAVWKLAWAHPEFGQILASCGFDQQILIWEELDTPVSVDVSENLRSSKDSSITGGADQVSSNADSKENVQGNSEGNVNAGDAGTNQPGTGGSKKNSRWDRVASLKGDGRETVNDMKFAPRHFGLCLATCSSDGYVRVFVADDVMNLENWTMSEKFEATKDKDEATSLSWNPSRFDSKMMVVGSTANIRIWVKNQTQRRWEPLADIPVQSNSGVVNDVCWAPNLGRSYHLIASAAANCEMVELWKLSWDEDSKQYKLVDKEAELPSKSEVWKCQWNITGTVLATSGDDGGIRLWRKNFTNRWNMITEEFLGSST